MPLLPEQEMALKVTELYIKHSLTEKKKRKMSIDDIVDHYHYTLNRIQMRSGNISTETMEDNMSILPGIPEAPLEYPSSDDETDALSSGDFL